MLATWCKVLELLLQAGWEDTETRWAVGQAQTKHKVSQARTRTGSSKETSTWCTSPVRSSPSNTSCLQPMLSLTESLRGQWLSMAAWRFDHTPYWVNFTCELSESQIISLSSISQRFQTYNSVLTQKALGKVLLSYTEAQEYWLFSQFNLW